VANQGKKPLESVSGPSGEGRRNMEKAQESNKSRESNSNKENEETNIKNGCTILTKAFDKLSVKTCKTLEDFYLKYIYGSRPI